MSDDPASTHPIAITGMHRSGTSMITRGLHESGLHLIGGDADALLEAADDNPEGFWENKAIVACNDDLLEAAGGAWDNPPALLPMAVDDPRLAAVIDPATRALAGLAENDRWGFKDPRLCLTAAFWLDLQPDLRFVISVRNPLEVALSLKRRNQNSYSLGLSLWERYYESILELVPEDRRIVTHYDTYFLDPVGELGRVCDFAGLEAAPLEVRSDLRHHDVGVSLDEANLGGEIRELYARLCDEAGAPAPQSRAVDEGQVRRLVLDGTVAARHADQRQKAIERLEERLRESQAAEKESREQLSEIRRESEARRAQLESVSRELDHVRSDTSSRFSAIEDQNARLIEVVGALRDTTAGLDERQRGILDRTNHVSDILDAVHVKLRAVEQSVEAERSTGVVGRVRRLVRGVARRVVGPKRTAKQTARATARQMPDPVKHNLRRVRRAVADGQAGNRVKERAQRVVVLLPGPAEKIARRGARVVLQSPATPAARKAAKRVDRRLGVSRRLGGTVSAPARRAPKRAVQKSTPAPRPKARKGGRSTVVPKGPATFKWQKGYERLVEEFVPSGAPWAVATPGCKAGVVRAAGRTGVAFPSADGQSPAADSVSLIAIVEAMRLRGTTRLVVPEGARSWYQGHPELRDHLVRSHPIMIDRPAAGLVFDLTSASESGRGLLAEVRDLTSGAASMPAVLDWTDLDIADDLPGFTTFSPPASPGSLLSTTLPYFDDSVEVVVTTDGHDLAEAARVASTAVVVGTRRGREMVVDRVVSMLDDAGPGVGVTVVASSCSPEVDDAVRGAAEQFGAALAFDVRPGAVEAETVVVIEAGVVPLPGALAAIVAAARRFPDSVCVAKVLDDQGRIESAGGMVFADGSVAGIAAGTLDVRAPWHEFSRAVCWGGGLVAAAGAVWSALPEFSDDDLPMWCGSAWASGRDVLYQSAAVAVRIESAGVRPRRVEGPWAQRLAGRPNRPAELGEGAWRFLLANDDVRATAPEADA
ncbi:MAG: sulfotransferase [Acidimicrobiales bacterium]